MDDGDLFKANAVGYGLAASIFTNDLRGAMTFVDRIEAGMVKVNEPTIGLALQAPFGGFKQSSANAFKEQGPAALDFYTRTKAVYITYGRSRRCLPGRQRQLWRRCVRGYSTTMAEVADKPSPHVLIVTGPQRERLFRRFSSLFAGRDGVEVMIDRRTSDRRHGARGAWDPERRSDDRRRKRPDWIVPPS